MPQILSWDGVSQNSTWTLTTFAETVTAGGRKQTVFTRISPLNVTMVPSAATGSVTLTFSAAIGLSAAWIGTRLLYCGRQLLVTGYTDATHLTATAQETLPGSQAISFNTNSNVQGTFAVGDEVSGSLSGASGIVIAWNATGGPASSGLLTVQLLPSSSGGIFGFLYNGGAAGDTIVGPNGSGTLEGGGGTGITNGAPQAVATWDDEVMNTFRGYPSSVFFDQNRLGFCNFPALPSGIGWSGIGLPLNFLVLPIGQAITADNAIFEFAPGKSQVYFVLPGMESSEFVFCDNAVYYIPITGASPLAPGSVAFNLLSAEGATNIRPQPAQQTILYVKAGGSQMGAVQAPGAYYRPYVVDMVSEFHSHLFTAAALVAIAVPQSSSQFEEKYAYVLRADGVVICGRYSIRNGLLDPGQDGKPKIGWLPWPSLGFTTWISAQAGDLIFTTTYYSLSTPGGWSNAGALNFGTRAGSPVYLIETLDATQYLDCAILVNSPPAALTPPGGDGPLWLFANGSVFLMDTGGRPMGVYQVDATGHIIPQNNGGENLSSAGLVAGQPWLSVLESFCPDASPGQSAHQRMFKRRISRMATYVSNSTGLVLARLFSDNITATSPPYGTVMNILRIPAWNQDDNPTQPPPWREEAYRWRPLGRSYDPRVAIIKDTPGPLIVHEIGLEATI